MSMGPMHVVPTRFCAEHVATPFALADGGHGVFRVCPDCVAETGYARMVLPRDEHPETYARWESAIREGGAA